MRHKANWWLPGLEDVEYGETLFNGYRVLVLHDEKLSCGWMAEMYNN